MQRVKPPFRADHVGSLLRTAPLKAAREKRKRGEITAEALTEIEDREIEGVIRKQEAAGLKSVTDGEYRRISWNYDFLENRSSFVASGGYEPVAELLFNTIKVHGYFMEYDTERAGGFEPLRFVPKGKTVVLGLVTTKTGALETKDAIKRRIEQAAKFADLDQLCLSPQCGFASTEEGNSLAEDEQWAKLRMIAEVAQDVWGE
jgi:methionine synthase II (cobalamin-independent)